MKWAVIVAQLSLCMLFLSCGEEGETLETAGGTGTPCVSDLDCKGDRICLPSGKCSDPSGNDPTETGGEAGSWTDPSSGLTWQVTPTGGVMTWPDAKAHCAGLSLDGGGWHLPTIGELRTLIRGCPATEDGGSCNVEEGDCLAWLCRDDSCSGCSGGDGPGEGGMYWPDEVEGDCCWYFSSSSVADHDNYVWGVNFPSGVVNFDDNNDDVDDGGKLVRCVH